jgi:hypothetical protein
MSPHNVALRCGSSFTCIHLLCSVLILLQIPIVRGVPRKDAKEFGGLSAFTSNAELINVRLHSCTCWHWHMSASLSESPVESDALSVCSCMNISPI